MSDRRRQTCIYGSRPADRSPRCREPSGDDSLYCRGHGIALGSFSVQGSDRTRAAIKTEHDERVAATETERNPQ